MDFVGERDDVRFVGVGTTSVHSRQCDHPVECARIYKKIVEIAGNSETNGAFS